MRDWQGRGEAPHQARKTVSRGWNAPAVFSAGHERAQMGYAQATNELRIGYG